MGLENSRCDSCNEVAELLLPLAVLDESPCGGEHMIIKYYCKGCYDIRLDDEDAYLLPPPPKDDGEDRGETDNSNEDARRTGEKLTAYLSRIGFLIPWP